MGATIVAVLVFLAVFCTLHRRKNTKFAVQNGDKNFHAAPEMDEDNQAMMMYQLQQGDIEIPVDLEQEALRNADPNPNVMRRPHQNNRLINENKLHELELVANANMNLINRHVRRIDKHVEIRSASEECNLFRNEEIEIDNPSLCPDEKGLARDKQNRSKKYAMNKKKKKKHKKKRRSKTLMYKHTQPESMVSSMRTRSVQEVNTQQDLDRLSLNSTDNLSRNSSFEGKRHSRKKSRRNRRSRDLSALLSDRAIENLMKEHSHSESNATYEFSTDSECNRNRKSKKNIKRRDTFQNGNENANLLYNRIRHPSESKNGYVSSSSSSSISSGSSSSSSSVSSGSESDAQGHGMFLMQLFCLFVH